MKCKPHIDIKAKQFTFGAELTAISPKYKDTVETLFERQCLTLQLYDYLTYQITDRMSKLSGIDTEDMLTSIDGHCIEHNTPVFYSIEDLTTYYKYWRTTIKDFGLEPQHRKVICGGNHIHIGFPTDYTMSFARSCFKLFHDFPVLALIFVDKDDTISCDPFNYKQSQSVQRFFCDGMSYSTLSRNNFLRNKSTCITLNNSCRTVEIRCLRAPTTLNEWNMQMQFIRYIHLYHSYNFALGSTIYKGKIKTFEQAREQFQNFVSMMDIENDNEWIDFCINRLKKRFA